MSGRNHSVVIALEDESVGWAKRPKAACPRMFN